MSPNDSLPTWIPSAASRAMIFDQTVICNPYLPHKPLRPDGMVMEKQVQFLAHHDVREVMYGGAAGGGAPRPCRVVLAGAGI